MLQSSLPTVICDTGFTDRQPEHLPILVAGVGVAPTEARLNLILPAVKWWRPTGNAPVSACLQGRCITFLPRPQKNGNWQAALVLPQAS